MIKSFLPPKPHRFAFGEGWLMAILLVIALAQIFIAFGESAGIARLGDRPSATVQNGGEALAKQAHEPLPPKESAIFPTPAARG